MSAIERAVTRWVNRPRDGTLRLWTIQPPEVWSRLRDAGTLHVDPDRMFPNPQDRDLLLPCYDWMREQMAKRVPGCGGHYPWWAYDHFMDLRFYRWNLRPPNARRVRLELALPPEEVLLSNYDEWFCVINGEYLPLAVDGDAFTREAEEWERRVEGRWLGPVRGPLPEPLQSERRASWERIFDLKRRRPNRIFQACFETLRFADVVRATEFTTRLACGDAGHWDDDPRPSDGVSAGEPGTA